MEPPLLLNCHTITMDRLFPERRDISSEDDHATRSSISNSTFDEHRWVIQVRRTIDELDLEEEEEEYVDIPVSIFNAPKSLMARKPDCYIPQQVALGPYHHWRPELYDMERYKLYAAKRTQKRLQAGRLVKFQHLVDQLAMLEARVRASYHKYLDFNGETLAWIMAVDMSFLLEFLEVFAIKLEDRVLRRSVTSGMSHLVDVTGRKSAHNAILRDLVMLENQIPLFLLRKMLGFQCSSLELADETLCLMLIGLYKELSPIVMTDAVPSVDQVINRSHLLDFLYHMVVPNLEELSESTEDQDEVSEIEQKPPGKPIYYIKRFISGLVSFFKAVVRSEPVKLLVKYPWTIISNLPVFRILKQPIDYLCFTQDKEGLKPENENNKPPLVEEISIPSVTDLSKAGVRFLPTNGGILAINFDHKTGTFYLPSLSLDVNVEVIMRNLVAYEACNASGPLVFTRYTELMNGIIDTKEDVKLLRERGIIVNRLKSDEEVANLWNGMGWCVRLTKVTFLDRVIEDVNMYYNGRWRVKIGRFMKLYVFGSWQLLALLAALFFLTLMTLQVFSSVLTCTSFLLMRNTR